MAYRIDRHIVNELTFSLIALWEGNDLPVFGGSGRNPYLFDDKDTAERVSQRLAAKYPVTLAVPHLPTKPITYEVVEVSQHAWARYIVVSYDRYQADHPNIVPAGRYDNLDDAKKHADSVTYKMVVLDSKAESRGFVYANYWDSAITPEQCGASQLACNIVNRTFLSLDGFAAMRKQMKGSTYTAEQFSGELARIIDRELNQVTEFVSSIASVLSTDEPVNGADFIDLCSDKLLDLGLLDLSERCEHTGMTRSELESLCGVDSSSGESKSVMSALAVDEPAKFDNYGFPALEIAGNIAPTDKELAEGFMLRSLHVLGIPHHCEFIRVEVKDELQQAWESDTSDPDNQERFDDMQESYSGCYLTCEYLTCELRGVDWVFRAFPFADF